MTHVVNVSDRVRKALRSQYRQLRSWRKVAENYHVNQKYVYDFVEHGIEPSANTAHGQEVRYRLGLDQRPLPAWVSVTVGFLKSRECPEHIDGALFARSGKAVKP